MHIIQQQSKHVNYIRTNTINTHQEKNHRIQSLQHITYKQNLPEQRNRKRDPESRKKPVHRNQILNDLDIRINRQGFQSSIINMFKYLKEKYSHNKCTHQKNLS